ncbi:MAG: class II aldolase/adducin family protein [Bdellovibrionales bacterium]|nr:class II aldolase/adducin family protein [Bdellovibrionales bacterium]
MKKLPTHVGFIIKNHGIYCWGKTLEDAQKHLEAFEYIFKILYFRSLKGF